MSKEFVGGVAGRRPERFGSLLTVSFSFLFDPDLCEEEIYGQLLEWLVFVWLSVPR